MTKEKLINKWLDNLKPMLLEISAKADLLTKAIQQIQNSIDEIEEEEE